MFSRNYDIDGFTLEEFEEKYKLIRAGLVEGLIQIPKDVPLSWEANREPASLRFTR